MKMITPKQREILEYLQGEERSGRPCPTHRELARTFAFRSTRAVACHIEALVRKGLLVRQARRSRSLRVVSPLDSLRRPVMEIPVYGSIPAGLPEDRRQEAQACVSVDIGTLGIRPSARTFALEVRGDSMIGRHILEGDMVILEHGMTPRNGDVVAALIDNESTLKTFVLERGKPCLRAENPKYPKLIPAQELVIQGVMVALVRKTKR